MARAPQRCGDTLVEHPTHREMNNTLAEAAREPIELLHGCQVLREPRFYEFRVRAPQIVAIESRIRLHSSGQQAAAKRAISQRRDLVFSAVGYEVGLDPAPEQIVRRLKNMQRG